MKRFADREDLGQAEVYQQYWSDYPEQDVKELLELIHREYQLPPGLLRPDDHLDKLLAPVKTSNPLKWLVYRLRAEDRRSELNFQLSKRQRQHGTEKAWQLKAIVTMNDLMLAWCGRLPLELSRPPVQ